MGNGKGAFARRKLTCYNPVKITSRPKKGNGIDDFLSGFRLNWGIYIPVDAVVILARALVYAEL